MSTQTSDEDYRDYSSTDASPEESPSEGLEQLLFLRVLHAVWGKQQHNVSSCSVCPRGGKSSIPMFCVSNVIPLELFLPPPFYQFSTFYG